MDTKLPKIPTLTMSKIIKLRDELQNNIIAPHEGKRLIGTDFTNFTSDIHDKMPSVPYSTLFKSIQHLAGIFITAEVNAEISWRLAGNQHHLRKGVVVPPYSRQLFPEWVPVQVWNVEKMMRVGWIGEKKDENKAMLHSMELDLVVMAGTPAGRHFYRICQEKVFRNREVKSMLGFTHYDKRLYNRYFIGENNYPMHDVRQLAKLRFFVYLDPVESKAGELFYKNMTCTSTFRKWNREQMKRRERQNYQCPKNYDLATMLCHNCEMGFFSCLAGCHPGNYIKKQCPKCHLVSNFTTDAAEWCVDCLARRA